MIQFKKNYNPSQKTNQNYNFMAYQRFLPELVLKILKILEITDGNYRKYTFMNTIYYRKIINQNDFVEIYNTMHTLNK